MRKRLLAVLLAVVVVAVFIFVPMVETTTANFGGGSNFVGWVSPSFALFQCGVATGNYGVQVPNGAVVNPYGSGPLWNCDYAHL